MKNKLVADILNRVADILEFQDVEFKPQAYRKVALAVESLTEDIADVYNRGELENIPGVGKHIAEKVSEIIEKGKSGYYEKLKKEVPIDLESLGEIPFLGIKKIQVLYQKLGVKTVADLEKALQDHKVRELPGFGEKTEMVLLKGIEVIRTRPRRFLYAQVVLIVNDVLQRLGKSSLVKRVEVAGSFRRGKETVGDLDFLVISSSPSKVMDLFVTLPGVVEVLSKGTTKSSVRLENGLSIDLRVVVEKEFGSAMNYFIGNKEHNVALRKFALSKGYTLSEYGLFTVKKKRWIAGRTENEIYDKLGMNYIEPELRENRGEIAVALKRTLPSLVAKKDIRGVFHNHSTWSDGNDSLLAMAQKAEQMGFEFVSFNDHYGHIGITNPLNEKRLVNHLAEIEIVRKKVGIRVFSGVEIDIFKDGTLPLSRAKLRALDVVVASVHVGLSMSENEMTKRVCTAMENYPIHILGHPMDRILNVREPLSLRLDDVFDTARRNNVFLEINAAPQRMDLSGMEIKSARDKGCLFALSTDAHDVRGLEAYSYGVLSARRGWLEKKDVLNCWNLKKIEKRFWKS